MTTATTRVTSGWIRDQIKAAKTPVVAKRGAEYFSISKRYASQMEGSFNVSVTSHEILVDINSQMGEKLAAFRTRILPIEGNNDMAVV